MNQKIRIPKFWGVHARPTAFLQVVLGAIPFVLLVSGYLYLSQERNRENPDDKLTPTPVKIVKAFEKVAFQPDIKTGKVVFWEDTKISLKRHITGAVIASVIALLIGMNMALFKGMDACLMPFLRFSSLFPPPIILPVLFLTMGVEESSKIAIIVFSIAPAMTLGIYDTVCRMAGNQITRSLSLGANQFDLVYRIFLPQVMPRLLEVLRNSLGMVWYSLVMAEAIAASSGIGYRIYLVRRFTQMDVIIPYAFWVVILGFTMNLILTYTLKFAYPWYAAQKEN